MKLRPPTNAPTPLPGRPVFTPSDQSACLCGSAAPFNGCCKDRLPGYQIGAAARAVGDNLEAALIAKRADLTQYTILHKTNTAPVLARNSVAAARFLTLDLNALSEIVGQLCILYHRLGRSAELPAMLERLRRNVDAPGWHRKITYHHAQVAHQLGDDDKARIEFAKLLPIEADETDIEIIQLYIPLYSAEIAFSRMIALCDRILELTTAGEDRLQYSCLKGFMYAMVGDEEAYLAAFKGAVASARATADKHKMTDRAKNLFANALTHLGSTTDDAALLDEAVATLQDLLAEQDAWTPFGRARLLADLGECYRCAGRWADGEAAYRDANTAARRAIASVFLAECIARQGRMSEAAAVIDGVDIGELDMNERYDYASLASVIAAESRDYKRIDSAIALLAAVDTATPYFEKRKLSMLMHLKDLRADLTRAATPLAAIRKLFAEPLRLFNRYTIMQPSVFGFGVNLNAILEDVHGPAGRKDKT